MAHMLGARLLSKVRTAHPYARPRWLPSRTMQTRV